MVREHVATMRTVLAQAAQFGLDSKDDSLTRLSERLRRWRFWLYELEGNTYGRPTDIPMWGRRATKHSNWRRWM